MKFLIKVLKTLGLLVFIPIDAATSREYQHGNPMNVIRGWRDMLKFIWADRHSRDVKRMSSDELRKIISDDLEINNQPSTALGEMER